VLLAGIRLGASKIGNLAFATDAGQLFELKVPLCANVAPTLGKCGKSRQRRCT
jgi:hypothetical protein